MDEQNSTDKVSSTEELVDPNLLPIVPVRNLVIFPGAVTHISIGREASVTAAELSLQHDRPLGILLQKDPTIDAPQPDQLYDVGTAVKVLRLVTAPSGTKHLICQGERRFRVIGFEPGYNCLVAHSESIEDASEVTETSRQQDLEIQARAMFLKEQAEKIAHLLPDTPVEATATLMAVDDPGLLADLVAGLLDIKPKEKQALLATFNVRERLDKVLEAVGERLKVLEISHEIGAKSQEKMKERQREFLLREQLRTIREELGEEAGEGAELEEIEKAIAEASMPSEIEEAALKELKRLRNIPDSSMEHSIIRTYLEWLTELPWVVEKQATVDIAKARRVLDEDHYGLPKVKRRILEYLAVRKLNPEGRSPILCFVGPPGVGKTSLGQSIARALDLKFVRASLGGVHDEAEIRGHRRTYIGALPGSIIQNIRRAGVQNPVFMLDEMDKLGAGVHGDPSAALLEVLDPEQNTTFADNYLGVPYDLSKIMFIGTANVLDNIPVPLRDRMEIIEIPGYTQDEKLEIAQRYLVERQLKANGLSNEQVSIESAALVTLIDAYTREAGVRNLEREIGALLRNAAVRIAEGEETSVHFKELDVAKVLGAPWFERDVQLRTSVPGVATGLAWTPVGGDILFVESSAVPGNGGLILTGQLGEVMKESAQAAVSIAKGRIDTLPIERAWFGQNDIHLHVPAGGIPKDGPSAGVAMFVAIMSLMTNKKVRSDIAMTGEISLRGQVLPVGGIKEKVLAALRAGINTVLLPARNRKDLEDIPEQAQAQMHFIWLDNVDDALKAAFTTNHTQAA